MEKKEVLRNNLLLHLTVIILGFTAILGKLISIPAVELVWYRTLMAVVILGLFMVASRRSLKIGWPGFLRLSGIGLIIGVHWICFFYSIKVSNVSVTLGCLSVTTLFTSFLEPLFGRKKISVTEVIIGLVIIFGIYLIFRFETRYVEGIIFSILAALFASVFSVLNKQEAQRHPPEIITFYEMLSGFAGVSIFMFLSVPLTDIEFALSLPDAVYLLILAGVCTAFAFSATVRIMQKLSAYQVVLAINLEPVYGILAACFIFGDSETMTAGFYAGASIILASVVFYTVFRALRDRKVV